MSEETAAFHVQDRTVLWNSRTHLLKCMGSDSKMMTVFMVTTIRTSYLTFCNIGVCGKEIIVTAHIHSWGTTPCQLYATDYAALTF